VLPASALAVALSVAALPASAATVHASPGSTVTRPVALVRPTAPQLTDRRGPARIAPKHVAVERAGLVLRKASSLRGRPYHYGASGPRSFDCSGFTRYVFRTAVGRSLPHSSAAQYRLSH
jgi:cell wall-associated NlpC family hydrolase